MTARYGCREVLIHHTRVCSQRNKLQTPRPRTAMPYDSSRECCSYDVLPAFGSSRNHDPRHSSTISTSWRGAAILLSSPSLAIPKHRRRISPLSDCHVCYDRAPCVKPRSHLTSLKSVLMQPRIPRRGCHDQWNGVCDFAWSSRNEQTL